MGKGYLGVEGIYRYTTPSDSGSHSHLFIAI